MTGVLAGIRWYLKEVSGQARWERYVDGCRARGEEPLDRGAWERHRTEHQERNPQGRCC